jgi:hypothetical protein
MPLGLTVLLLVVGVTVIFGVAGYLIEKSAERNERKQGH